MVLFVIMSLIFLSLRAGLLSLVPNVLPIIVLFGLMGWTGITLNISTSMIAVIAIGIAVDDTIHYFSEFNVQLRAHRRPGARHPRTSCASSASRSCTRRWR